MRKLLTKIVFCFHSIVVLFYYGLFFVPQNWYPNKIPFHFNLCLIIVLHQFIWGFLITPWTRKYRMVCILTTLTQALKGQKISDSKNYNYSFVKESFGKLGVSMSHRFITILTLAIFGLVTIQYFFFQ